jgi:hypothetical protein
MANHRRVHCFSPSQSNANEQTEPRGAAGSASPSAAAQPNGPLARLKHAFDSFRQVERARTTDVSSALFHRSRSGRTWSPWHFTRHDREQDHADRLPPLPSRSHRKEPDGAKTLAKSAIARTISAESSDSPGVAIPPEAQTPERSDALRFARSVRDSLAAELTVSPLHGDELDRFAARLSGIASLDGASPVAQARTHLFACAVRAAGARDVWFAERMLQHIAVLDFDAPHRRTAANDEERRAWHVVRQLSRSSLGFSMIEHIRTAAGTPFKDRTHRFAVRTLLESAQALDHAPGDIRGVSWRDYSPGAVSARNTAAPLDTEEPGPTALAKRAFDAARSVLEHGPDSLTPDQCGALLAWRQGFCEDGRHSEFSQARERLHKFVTKTIPRVEENRWKTLLPRMLFGTHTSPLSALQFGTRGVPRQTIEREQAALKRKTSETLVQMKDSAAVEPSAVLTHSRAPRNAGARAARQLYVEHRDASIREKTRAALSRLIGRVQPSPSSLLAHARTRSSVVELAALQVWLDRGGFPGGHPDPAALVDIAKRAHDIGQSLATPRGMLTKEGTAHRKLERLFEATASWQKMSGDQLAKTKPFSRLAKQPFDVIRLAAWGKVAHVPEDDPFWLEVQDLLALENPSPAAGARDIASVRSTLTEVIMGLQSGQRLRLSDGGHQGVSTRGLNGTTKLFFGGVGIPVSPRLDLRASRTREAIVEVSRSTHGVELFIGRADGTDRHVGAGLLVGYDIDVGLTSLRAGLVTNATLHAHEISRPRGVSIRVARRIKPDGSGYDDQAMRAKLAEINDFLFSEAGAAPGGGPNGLWNRLAERYWNDPDISISWTDGVSDTKRRGVTVDVTATVEFYELGVDGPNDPGDLTLRGGPSAGIGRQTSRQTSDSVERSGSLRVEHHRVGTGSFWQERQGVAPGFAHPLSATGHESIGLFSIDTLVRTRKLDQRNTSAKLQLVREEERLVHRACLVDIEYSNVQAYVSALQDSRKELLQLLLASENMNARVGGANSAEPPAQAIARANQRINAHLADVLVNRSPHLTYVLRHRMRKHAAEALDANDARLSRAGEDLALRKRIEADNERILSDRSSWMLVELKVRERTTRSRSIGPNAIARLNTRTSATGDREIVVENVPFQVLEALDPA